MANFCQRIAEIDGRVEALCPARRNGLKHHVHQLWR